MATKSVWAILSAIDCNDHIDQKGQFSYLAWTWAWAMVKDNYPEADYHLESDVIYPDQTMEVRCTVRIEGMVHTMWLPVLDFKNRAIANPNAFDVNSARMRVLVKCCAMHGLGHYIYAGESIPVEPSGPDFTPDQQAAFNMLIANLDGWGIKKFAKGVDQSVMDGLFNSAPKGEKTALKSKCRELVQSANNELKRTVEVIQEAIEGNEGDTVSEILGELDDIEHEFVMAALSEIEILQMTNLQGE